MLVTDGIYRASLALVGLATVPPPSHAQRLAHLAMFVLSFFVFRVFVSRLTALAAVPKYSTLVPDWGALLRLPAGRVAIVTGSAAEAWVRASTAPRIAGVLSLLAAYPTEEAAAAAVRAGAVDALVTESCTAKFLALSPPCAAGIDTSYSIGVIGVGFWTNSTATAGTAAAAGAAAIPSRVVDALNAGIVTTVEFGLFSQLEDAYVMAPGNCATPGAATVQAQPVSAAGLQSVALLLGAAVAIAFGRLLMERRGRALPCVKWIAVLIAWAGGAAAGSGCCCNSCCGTRQQPTRPPSYTKSMDSSGAGGLVDVDGISELAEGDGRRSTAPYAAMPPVDAQPGAAAADSASASALSSRQASESLGLLQRGASASVVVNPKSALDS